MHSVGRSKTGLPTITERGGGATNTGDAVVVAGEHGDRVKPLFVPKGYSNGGHAIFVARVGMHILEGGRSRGGENVTAYRIAGIGTTDNPDELVLVKVGEYENGDGNIPEFLGDAMKAVLDKAGCYHCREPHFIGKEQEDV